MKLRRNSKPRPTPKSIKLDLTGKRFGKWTVLGFWESNKGGVWLCECDCGDRHAVHRSDLRSGSSSSCATCASHRLGLTIGGVEYSTADVKRKLGVSTERVRQLRNRAAGLCACGRKREEGFTRCADCRKKRAELKAKARRSTAAE